MGTNKNISRRQFLRGAAVMFGGAALAACTPAATPAPAAPAGAGAPAAATAAPAAPAAAAVRLSVWGDVTDKAVYDAIIADFAKVEPSITVTAEQYPGGYYDKIQANFAANTPADVIYFQGWSWQVFADKGVLQPLDEYINKDSAKALWPAIDNYTNNCSWYGKTYMSVADTGPVIMFYNKDLFDKKGVPMPKAGWTYADFQSAVEKLSYKEGDVQYYGYAQANGWNGNYGRSIPWMRMDGTLEWDSQVEPKKSNWLDPVILDKLQWTVVDVTAKGWSPSPATIQGGGVTIATGRVAMTIEGPWSLANMQGPQAVTKGGIPFDVIEPPLGTAGKDMTCSEVHGHVMAKVTKVPDAAWKIMNYVMTDPGQQRIAEGGRMCGTPDNIEKLWVPKVQAQYNFSNGKAFADAMRTGQNPIFAGAGANYDAMSGTGAPLTVAWDAMLNGTSAKDALTTAQPLLQKMLDDYWAKKKS